MLQMTPAGIREERARTQQKERRKAEQLSQRTYFSFLERWLSISY